MPCPICGANCKCRKRGPGGICCDCHKHKVRKLLVDRNSMITDEFRRSFDQHCEWMRCTFCHAPNDQAHKENCPLAQKQLEFEVEP